MARYLIVMTKTEAKRYELSKDIRPMTTVRHRLFRTDEKYQIKVKTKNETFVPYAVDATSPISTTDTIEWVDPNETMAYIDIALMNGGRGISKLNGLASIKMEWLIYGIIGVVILLSVVRGFL